MHLHSVHCTVWPQRTFSYTFSYTLLQSGEDKGTRPPSQRYIPYSLLTHSLLTPYSLLTRRLLTPY